MPSQDGLVCLTKVGENLDLADWIFRQIVLIDRFRKDDLHVRPDRPVALNYSPSFLDGETCFSSRGSKGKQPTMAHPGSQFAHHYFENDLSSC